MLVAAGMWHAKGKIVFTGTPGVEGPEAERSEVSTMQNIQEKKRIE